MRAIIFHQITTVLQSGASSQAKHGGAYFLAVYGSIKDPMAATGPGPNETLEPSKLVGIAIAPMFFQLQKNTMVSIDVFYLATEMAMSRSQQ